MEINQAWFEMQDLRKRVLDSSVWIPLRSEKTIRNTIEFGHLGYYEDFIGAGSLMVSRKDKAYCKNLNWMDIGIRHFHNSSFEEEEYLTADIYITKGFRGNHLVLNQSFDNGFDKNEWHLHQDLVISLGLKREKDIWICPQEGYVEAAKLERDHNGKPISLSIKNQFLKDYLRARDCGLYVSSYQSRTAILDNTSGLDIDEKGRSKKKGKDFWEYRVMEIHEGGGFPFGQSISVSKVGRTDIFENEDIPDISKFPTEENTHAEFYDQTFNGRKLYRVMSELWKYDWVNPGKISPIVLGQSDKTKVYFILDAEGQKKSGDTFKRGGKWLWFKPEMATVFLAKRGSFLEWYTKNTGIISCGPNGGIHFGLNDLGLITVYAKDIGYLPIWQQQIWAGFNVSPEGGISKELHDAQIKARPASTLAPENFFQRVLSELNDLFLQQYRFKLFREHQSVNEIIPSIQRFRATNEKGLFSLAKDIARVIVDDINIEDLQKIVVPPKGTKWGSLKTIENLLAQKISKEEARALLSPIVGIYELRHGDAHLPGSEIGKAFDLIGIDKSQPYILQGYQMLFASVEHLYQILRIIEK